MRKSSGELRVVKELIENGAMLDKLMGGATSESHLEIVKVLLENGAIINLFTTSGAQCT
jgi:hypothetical protein